jgi:hypothetical protein
MRDLLGLEGAYTPTTLPSSGADFEMFEAWCADAGKLLLPAPKPPRPSLRTSKITREPRSAIRKIHRLLRRQTTTEGERGDTIKCPSKQKSSFTSASISTPTVLASTPTLN